MSFPKLWSLKVTREGCTGIGGPGDISHATLANLLKSNYPNLQILLVDLSNYKDNYLYELPDEFLSGERLPKICEIEIAGEFKSGQVDKLLASPVVNAPDLMGCFEEMTEPQSSEIS